MSFIDKGFEGKSYAPDLSSLNKTNQKKIEIRPVVGNVLKDPVRTATHMLTALSLATSNIITPQSEVQSAVTGKVMENHRATEQILTDEEAYKLRMERISTYGEYLNNHPEEWNKVPESCRNGMISFYVLYPEASTQSINTKKGSGAIVTHEQARDINGEVMNVYQILTANHVVLDENSQVIQQGTLQIFPRGGTENFPLQISSYQQFVDENGVPQDLGLLTVMGYGPETEIDASTFNPLSLDNVSDWANYSSDNSSYYALGTPVGAFGNYEMISVVKATAVGTKDNGNSMIVVSPGPDTGTTAPGASGGPVCDSEGHHVGVISEYVGSWAYDFIIEQNPPNIRNQIDKAIEISKTKIINQGFRFD